jgi:hypothetical protein
MNVVFQAKPPQTEDSEVGLVDSHEASCICLRVSPYVHAALVFSLVDFSALRTSIFHLIDIVCHGHGTLHPVT